ncbi:MAG: sigma-54-dependent Fis family transcriptional regulator [Deltaproteobacteria bacterium]|nr:sigma-54-dependent Fis family transcriptional regulator [Deltaproteobacteria bacterium]
MIGESKSILQVFKMIEKVCDTNTTVLIHGESGTGKELIARALHFNSERREGPFIPVNCGAIPSELLESELFGHEKGAFTHAVRTRMGRFELADGGTVFLDEVAEMSPMLQVKLLRVLQDRQFERIGGTKTIMSDFRVVAATNRDLEEDVKQGKFREDLYYRLLVIPIYAPPLRQRFSDIPLLVEKFLHKFNKTKKRNVKGITEEVMERLFQYSWPGNVRELENLIERMVILAVDDVIGIDDLPERFLQKGHGAEEIFEIPEKGFSLSDVVGDYEKRLIIQALNQVNRC